MTLMISIFTTPFLASSASEDLQRRFRWLLKLCVRNCLFWLQLLQKSYYRCFTPFCQRCCITSAVTITTTTPATSMDGRILPQRFQRRSWRHTASEGPADVNKSHLSLAIPFSSSTVRRRCSLSEPMKSWRDTRAYSTTCTTSGPT